MVRPVIRRHGEHLFVGILGALAQIEVWTGSEWAGERLAISALALVMAAALLLRLRAPLVTLGAQVAGMLLLAAITTGGQEDPMTVVLLALVGIYSAGAHTRGREVLIAATLVAGATIAEIALDPDGVGLGALLFFGLFICGPFLVGVAIRIRREREVLLLRQREERARLAVADERARIARELHDVVAHAISVIVLQARGARHTLEDDREAARDAIEAIERTASQGLAEMRRLLAVLRADEAATLAPQPSLAHLDVLAGEVRSAGLPVEVRVLGDPRELAPGVDASAYRIAQEALTNSLRHAGPAHAVVTVRYGDEALELEVADDGAGSGANGHGHGLIGMRERAAVFGGSVEAGPGPDGGYVVQARLPL